MDNTSDTTTREDLQYEIGETLMQLRGALRDYVDAAAPTQKRKDALHIHHAEVLAYQAKELLSLSLEISEIA